MPLALMALVGTFGLNFQVILPLLARFSFGGGRLSLRDRCFRRWASGRSPAR